MNNINVNGKAYRSLLSCCKGEGLSYSRVYSHMTQNGVSPQEAVDYCIKTRPGVKRVYTEKEIDTMRKIAEIGLSSTVAAKILDRPVLSVRKKATELGISFHSTRHLNDREMAFLLSHFGKLNYQTLSEALMCDIRTVQYHGRRSGYTKSRSRTVEAIAAMAGRKTAKEIADELGITEQSVRAIGVENRISLACPERSGRRPWTEEEDAILRMYHGTEGCKALARRLTNRVPGSVRTRLKVLGLR